MVPAVSGDKTRCPHHQRRVVTNPASLHHQLSGKPPRADWPSPGQVRALPAGEVVEAGDGMTGSPPQALAVFRYECQAPSAPTRIKSQATAVTDLQHILKGVQAGDQEGGTLGKTGRTRHVLYIFRRRSYEPRFLHLPVSSKALKSLT